ncbi:hypothetical protein SPRG_12568 [Saprolegnia parasitica CBS 223.65]|uniref:RING-type domain-containing protein n=1 Tax=Saprolegnia parasitica (strain CBS 223.65) TaxID=695850 RepID=A0A067BWD5_SAPPC|nr:hypothetical protein SPRG_12568 [Saprolegnia parasitica CBS 223.65]KDO22588.1 hypothetical protein SPRG_12568 [Saprolegnia parasitica CBS 223.65]|eukprot:XP_012206704.1 hypothetical protein SPRG_12568 [Saprolegnia parasitica CBS 223.65]
MPLSDLVHDHLLLQDDVASLKAAQVSDLKQARVHSSAKNVAYYGSSPFTVYTLIATCPGTKAWWVLKKRYSQFFSLRKRLLHLAATAPPAIQTLLAPIADADFPKKHLLVSVNNKAIINERKATLQRFTATLIGLRAGCVLATLEHAADDVVQGVLDTLYDLLQDFLEVPHHENDGLQKHSDASDDDDGASTSLSSPDEAASPNATRLAPPAEDDTTVTAEGSTICTICLCELSTNDDEQAPAKKVRFEVENDVDEDAVLALPCGHKFHEECVMYWVEQKNSCPVCHTDAFDGTVL